MGKSTLYSQDFLQWTQEQIYSLRHGRWSELDVENLIEELEDLGRSEKTTRHYCWVWASGSQSGTPFSSLWH
ncbi:MAG: DUF29 family protein [Leptolyngbyaceae cyanobacterium]